MLSLPSSTYCMYDVYARPSAQGSAHGIQVQRQYQVSNRVSVLQELTAKCSNAIKCTRQGIHTCTNDVKHECFTSRVRKRGDRQKGMASAKSPNYVIRAVQAEDM